MNFQKTEIKIRGEQLHKSAIIYRRTVNSVLIVIELKENGVKILDAGNDSNVPTLMMKREGCQASFIQFSEFLDWVIFSYQIKERELRLTFVKVEE